MITKLHGIIYLTATVCMQKEATNAVLNIFLYRNNEIYIQKYVFYMHGSRKLANVLIYVAIDLV